MSNKHNKCSREEILSHRIRLDGKLREQQLKLKAMDNVPKPVRPVVVIGSDLLHKLLERV